jgi:hypothetical protein
MFLQILALSDKLRDPRFLNVVKRQDSKYFEIFCYVKDYVFIFSDWNAKCLYTPVYPDIF